MPGAPLLRTTDCNAASMLSGLQIASIRYCVDAGLSGSVVATAASTSRASRRGASPRSGSGKASSSWYGDRLAVMRLPIYLPFPSTPFRGPFGPSAGERPTIPSADFCIVVRMTYALLSPEGHKCRSLGVRLAAFIASPPDLQSWLLMDMDFAIGCPLVQPVLPRIRFLFVGSRLCSTLPSDGPSRFRPCASLVLHLHQVARGTCTPKLSAMSDTQPRAFGAPLSGFEA
jgi:hypothetical protein